MNNGNGVFIVAELPESGHSGHFLELVAPAKNLANGQPVTAVIVSDGNPCVQEMANEFAKYGVSQVISVQAPELATFNPQLFASAVAEVIKSKSPATVLFSATTRVRDYAPRVALKVDGGLLSNLTDVKLENNLLQGTKACLAESMLATVTVKDNAAVQLATIKPKSYEKPAVENDAATASVETFTPNLSDNASAVTLIEVKQADQDKIKLEDADIIVSGGRGLQAPENFALVESLAQSLNAGVGASRAIVDAGWRPHSEQVGQTGKTVNPKVYVAVGISGAIQHLVGMRTSDTIIAINRDGEAPIFKVADFGIVGDALEVLPKLTESIKSAKMTAV